MADKPMIRIRFDPKLANVTYIAKICGNINQGEHTMNIGCLSSDAEYVGLEKYAILHQFGHAFGLTHEHPATLTLDEQSM